MILTLSTQKFKKVREINIGITNIVIRFFDDAPKYIIPEMNKLEFIEKFESLVLEDNEKGFINQANQISNFFGIVKAGQYLSYKGINDTIYNVRTMINIGIWSMISEKPPTLNINIAKKRKSRN